MWQDHCQALFPRNIKLHISAGVRSIITLNNCTEYCIHTFEEGLKKCIKIVVFSTQSLIPPPPLICWPNTWIEGELLDDLYNVFQIIQICFSIIIGNRFLGVWAVFKDIRAWLWEFFRAHFKKTERKKFQGKWILWKTSAGVQNCPNPMKSVKIKHNPKIASWAKIYKNANFKGSLSTLSFRKLL